MEVDVFLAGWEIECCEPPPGEGDRVTWPLLWGDDPAGPGAVDLPWTVEEVFAGVGPMPGGLLLRHGTLYAWWIGLSADAVPRRGSLSADLHGGLPDEVLPPTTATVASVRVVEQAYRQDATGSYIPIDGGYVLRPVVRSPQWFTGGFSGPEDPLPEVLRRESGVLVGLQSPE
ncbi:DUF6578 domain-containing protein [Geodermatophilus sp. URMC 64]